MKMTRILLSTLVVLMTYTTLTNSELNAQNESADPRSKLRTLNSYFPFEPPTTVAEWDARSEQLRSKMRFALGLVPEPTRTALNPVIRGLRDMGDYTIEKVYFESMPGFHVTGSLYKPKNIQNRRVPGVLCPHGHHRDGRFRKATESEIDEQIQKGAEKFRNNARSPLQARCAHLAKMGCIVFHYDMLGYADSQQIGYNIAHRFAQQRPEMNSADGWGLFSPQAESHGQCVMSLQTWNSIRALDFLESIPQVDAERIGVTGASGGGTQTFILCAVDPRPAIAFPAVMVSTSMQGGCTCENCCNLRVGAGNVDFAALFAPKPLGLTAADDWTREMETKGFPELQQLYRMLGQPGNVHLTARLEFEHNYNQVCREAMYQWFAKHFGLAGPTTETEIEFLEPNELTVYDDQHRRPRGGDAFERELLQWWAEDAERQLAEMSATPSGQSDFATMVSLFHDSLMGHLDTDFKVEERPEMKLNGGPFSMDLQFVNSRNERFSARFQGSDAKASTVLLLDSEKTDVFDATHPRHSLVQRLLDSGMTVGTVDHTFVKDLAAPAPRVPNHRDFAGYTLGYNSPRAVYRAQDVIGLLRSENLPIRTPGFLIALDSLSVPGAILAAHAVKSDLNGIVVDTAGFRFATVDDIRSPNLVPGAAKLGDLPGLLSPVSDHQLLFIGEEGNDTANLTTEAKVELIYSWVQARVNAITTATRAPRGNMPNVMVPCCNPRTMLPRQRCYPSRRYRCGRILRR